MTHEDDMICECAETCGNNSCSFSIIHKRRVTCGKDYCCKTINRKVKCIEVNYVKCDYCGDEEGTEEIADPNTGLNDVINLNIWHVCKVCKEVISLQQGLSIAVVLGDEEGAKKYNERLIEIAKKTGKPILNAQIFQNKDGSYDAAIHTIEVKSDV